MSQNNRISTSRAEDLVRTKLSDLMSQRSEKNARPFHLGQVIDSADPKNANRLKVRIPLLDDVFYTDDQGNVKDSIGDDKLPYCVPANGRFIDTPENGCVVLVGLLDPEKPYTGRIWFTAMTELNVKDIFDVSRLGDELLDKDAWKNAEDSLEVKYNNTPGLRDRPTLKSKTKKTNSPTGVRGKNKNKLLFDKDKTTLIQNEGENKESKLELTENVVLMGKELEILSSQSSSKQSPVFADPLFKFMQEQLNLIKSIINILTTTVGIDSFTSAPITGTPAAATLTASYAQLLAKFNTLKQPGQGSSKYIKIN